jgi:hypothetical protein
MISELATRVFQARDVAHRQHWATESYAEHVALGAFYEGVVDAVDAVVENYQGTFGKIATFDVETETVKDIRAYLQDEADWIESNLTELCGGSDSVSNLLQTLIAVYTKTVFLLGLK